ncbi:MAG: hypothetical protein IKV30_06210 [Clostridia bacterium]|nr:hypothetical protein [Clostridia bacterium]
MTDAERRLERANEREIRKEKGDKRRKIIFDLIAVLTLAFLAFWGFGGGAKISSQMADKPISEFYFALSSGKIDKLEAYVINGFSIKTSEDKDVKPGEEVFETADPNSAGAEILGLYNKLRREYGYNMTVLYEKEGKEKVSAERLAELNEVLKEYGVGPANKAAVISYTVRISGKKSVLKNTLYEGKVTTVRIDGKWYIMPGTLEYSEVTP